MGGPTIMPTTETKRLQCRHILPEGRRCGSPCLRGEPFCYYHHTSRKPVQNLSRRRARQGAFTLPMPEDRAAVQLSIGEVLARIAQNQLEPRRAGLLLYGLQIALQSLPKPVTTSVSNKKHVQKQPQPQPHVEEIVLHPTHGLLAPEAEFQKDPANKTLEDILLEQWARYEEKEVLQQNAAEPTTLPNLQASTAPTSNASPFCRSQNLRSCLTRTSKSTPKPNPCKTLHPKVQGGQGTPPHTPEDPNPFTPRSVRSSDSTSSNSASIRRTTRSCATRSPANTICASSDKFVSTTLISPRYPGSITPASVVSPRSAIPDRSSINAPNSGGIPSAIPVGIATVSPGPSVHVETQYRSAARSPKAPTCVYRGTCASG